MITKTTITRKEIAQIAGVSTFTVKRWEKILGLDRARCKTPCVLYDRKTAYDVLRDAKISCPA